MLPFEVKNNKLSSAGNNTKSNKSAILSALTVTIAKLTFGTKLLTPKMANVTERIRVVSIIAFPL